MDHERYYIGTRWRSRVEVSWHEGEYGGLLDPRLDLRNHSPDGFEWGYGGSGPSQLALAMLADACRADVVAQRHYQAFKREVLSTLPYSCWIIHRSQVLSWLRERQAHDQADDGADLRELENAEE